MKTDLKTPLKIKGSGDHDRLFDADGNYLAVVSATRLPEMLEVVRRVNAYDAMVEALEKIERGLGDDSILASAAMVHCKQYGGAEPITALLGMRVEVINALALAKEVKC